MNKKGTMALFFILLLLLLMFGMHAWFFWNPTSFRRATSFRREIKVGIFGDLHLAGAEIKYGWNEEFVIGGAGAFRRPTTVNKEIGWVLNTIKKLEAQGVDFCIQMGDYATDRYNNTDYFTEAQMIETQRRWFNNMWTATSSGGTPLYTVMGNHDFGNARKSEILSVWARPANLSVAYYSFDMKGFHFVVLDSQDYDKGFGGPAQTSKFRISYLQKMWLIEDLESTSKPTFLFIHIPLSAMFTNSGYNSLRNGEEIRNLLENYPHVIACFEAHYHNKGTNTDAPYHWRVGRVHYFGTGFPNQDLCTGMLTIKKQNSTHGTFTYHAKGDFFDEYWEFSFDM